MTQIITNNGGGGGGGGGDGDMKKSVYDPNNVNANAFDYDNFINTPTIPAAQIQSDWNEADNTKLDYIKNKPTIPTKVSDLSNDSGYITGITSGDVTTALGYTPYNSSNPSGYISGITSGDVTTALGYTPVNPSNLGTAASKNTGTSSGNVPVLDSNGKLNTSTLPGVALTDTFTVTNKADLTSLSSADQGDIGIVTSESKTYVLSQAPYSTAANWKELLTPTDTVTSVNSQTGAVVLDADDISDSTTTNKFVTASDKTTWNNKQNALTTQTAYTTQGSATKVPQISTNTLGQVTGITEVTITQPDISGLVSGPVSSTDGHLAVFDGATGKIVKDGGAIPTGVPSGGTNGDVLTNVSGTPTWQAPSGGDVVVSSQANNILTSGTKLRAGTEANYQSLGTYDSNCIYLTIE